MNTSEKRAALAGAIREGRFVVAPGVYDMISSRVADRMGFEALYMTGYGVAASLLGLPDAGLATYADLEDRVRTIASGTRTPLICDADTGFGGLLNVRHTVRGYEEAGCAAIQLEDQEIPKKCGHTPGRRVVPTRDMAEKVQVAAEARRDPNFLIVARTDARTSLGLDAAIERARAYAAAGADVLFVEAPESEEEIARIGESIDKPLLANMVDGGKTPMVSADRLKSSASRLPSIPRPGCCRQPGPCRKRSGLCCATDRPPIWKPRRSPSPKCTRSWDSRRSGLSSGGGHGKKGEAGRDSNPPLHRERAPAPPPRRPARPFASSECETLGMQPMNSRLRGNDAIGELIPRFEREHRSTCIDLSRKVARAPQRMAPRPRAGDRRRSGFRVMFMIATPAITSAPPAKRR